jgi:hypothetical protein
MTKALEITDSVKAELNSIIDARCMKIICLLAGIISAITLPPIGYAYFSDQNHAESIVVRMDKKIDLLIDMRSDVETNKTKLASLEKNQDQIKSDIRTILTAGNEEK